MMISILIFTASYLIAYPIVYFTVHYFFDVKAKYNLSKAKIILYALTDEESKAIYFTAKDPQLLKDYKVKFEIRGDHLKIIKLVEE